MDVKRRLLFKYSISASVLLILIAFAFRIISLSIDKTLVDAGVEIAITDIVFFIVLLAVLFWAFQGIKKVGSEFIGCVLEFGRPLYQVDPGLHFIPSGFCELRLETKLAIEEQIPDDNKNPIRITHGKTIAPTGDPLDTRLTTSVNFTYRYKITDYVSFIQNIGNRSELRKQVRDVIVNLTAIECSKLTLALNLDRREQINYLLEEAVKQWTQTWGVKIIAVQLREIDLGNEIDKAQTSVSVSAITNINNAQKIAINGAAEAEVHKEIASKLGIDDKAAIYQVETLANVWRKSNADLNLYGNDVQQLFGMLMSIYKDKGNENDKLP